MSDNGWTVASGKRTRSVKINKKHEEKNPAKRRKESSSEEDDLVLNVTGARPEISFPNHSKKKKQKQRSLHPEGISMQDLQSLIFWIYDIGPNPNWVFLKNKALIKKVFLVSVGGLNNSIYQHHQASFPKVSSIFKSNSSKITIAPGSEFKIYSPLQALLYVQSKSKKKKANPIEATFPHPASFYCHSLHQLASNGYPLQVKSVKEGIQESTKQPETVVEYEQRDGFLVFGPRDDPTPDTQQLIAIDCEMCLTKAGSELTRVTAVDMNGEIIYDQLVKPKNPIVDYLTRYSGITAELLDPVTTTLEDVQDHMKSFISKDTILVGHSLENDLIALKVCHFKVIDTSIWFPHSSGPPSKNSLKALVHSHLHRVIQTGSHDSAQDAIAAMDLALLKIKHGPTFGISKPPGVSIFDKLRQKNKNAIMIDKPSLVNNHCPTHGIPCDSDEEIVSKFKETLQFDNPPDFVNTQMHSLNNYYKSQQEPNSEAKSFEDVLQSIDNTLADMYDSLPVDSLMIVTSGQANLANCSKLWKEKRDNEASWTDKQSQVLRDEISKLRTGVTMFALKR